MTRAAAESGIEHFVDEMVTATVGEFSVSRALRGGVRGPGGALVDRLLTNNQAVHRLVVEPELRHYRAQVLDQFDHVLAYAAGDAPLDAYADDLLAVDNYWQGVRENAPTAERDALRERLLTRYDRLATALTPLVVSEADAFWDAVCRELTVDEATDLVETTFSFTDPAVEYRHLLSFETSFEAGEVLGGGLLSGTLPTVTVDFTDEAIRSMRRAETRVTRETLREVERRFAADPE